MRTRFISVFTIVLAYAFCGKTQTVVWSETMNNAIDTSIWNGATPQQWSGSSCPGDQQQLCWRYNVQGSATRTTSLAAWSSVQLTFSLSGSSLNGIKDVCAIEYSLDGNNFNDIIRMNFKYSPNPITTTVSPWGNSADFASVFVIRISHIGSGHACYFDDFSLTGIQTATPTNTPSEMPTTVSPSAAPTMSPTTAYPTMSPTTAYPTMSPTSVPTLSPSFNPTVAPSLAPTASPSFSPSLNPTVAPSIAPTVSPTISPTAAPVKSPTLAPFTYELCNSAGWCYYTDIYPKLGQRTSATFPVQRLYPGYPWYASTYFYVRTHNETCMDPSVTIKLQALDYANDGITGNRKSIKYSNRLAERDSPFYGNICLELRNTCQWNTCANSHRLANSVPPDQGFVKWMYSYRAPDVTTRCGQGYQVNALITFECSDRTLNPTTTPTTSPTKYPTHTTATPTGSPSLTPSVDPTIYPSTASPTLQPSFSPTLTTLQPSTSPSVTSVSPTKAPIGHPSSSPSHSPTGSTLSPTLTPSDEPSVHPSVDPTMDPVPDPTNYPSINPTSDPTTDPSVDPSFTPTSDPSMNPSQSPTGNTMSPTIDPTSYPSFMPSDSPTNDPTNDPTNNPSSIPTSNPSEYPSNSPTYSTNEPTYNPTNEPTLEPTFDPTEQPNMEAISTQSLVVDETSSESEENEQDQQGQVSSDLIGTGAVVGIVVAGVVIVLFVIALVWCKIWNNNEKGKFDKVTSPRENDHETNEAKPMATNQTETQKITVNADAMDE